MKKPDLPENAHIHMVGVGGAGVSGLAVVMAQMGYSVSGSDLRPGPVEEKLRALGARVFAGHNAAFVSGADLVVASAAVPDDNPELVAARQKGIPVVSRAEMLGRLMSGNFGIAVAGTHGKTTTTSMLAVVLEAAGRDPTILIGGDLDLLNGNAKLGRGDLFLSEACEAFNSFHELAPRIAVVTNIEGDHLDYHGSLEGVIDSFRRFLSRIEEDGCAVMGVDCPNVRGVIGSIGRRVSTYGLGEDADCRAHDVDVSTPEPSFRADFGGSSLGRFTLRVPGIHNVRNALAVLAVGCELDVDPDVMRDALAEFRGVGRRFDVLGTANDIMVVDDYAHHPTEIRATLSAARCWGRRIVAVFQPHLYSRTEILAADFADSLKQADAVFLTEIYPAREKPRPGVSASMIADLINADLPGKARFVADKERLADELMPALEPGDLVVVMGAGDIRSAAEDLLARLNSAPKGRRPAADRKKS